MKPLWRAEEARAFDHDVVERVGLPSVVLMENAGWGALHAITARFPACRRALVLGGPGQNGGDAWVVARLMAQQGFEVRCVLLGEVASVRGDARINLDALSVLQRTPDVASGVSDDAFMELLAGADLVVDGIFGTGLSRDLEGDGARLVRHVLASSVPVVSLDMPSGIDADTGSIRGVAIQAALTVTFGAEKRGLRTGPGVVHAGEVVVSDLGAPVDGAGAYMLERSDLALVRRARDTHKGQAGRVAIIAGRQGTSGAALLAGRGAFRAGAGLVHLWSRANLDGRVVEMMAHRFEAAADVLEACEGMDAAAIGPGLGVAKTPPEIALGTRAIALGVACPAVIDADALSVFAGEPERFRDRGPAVLTPHPGEAARLLGTTSAAIEADRFAAAGELARRTEQVVVLKGACTLIAYRDAVRVSPFGTSAMGVAGSGDVLSGIIAALLVEHVPFDAACLGVALHALAGESAAQADRGLLASEIADAVPGCIAGLLK